MMLLRNISLPYIRNSTHCADAVGKWTSLKDLIVFAQVASKCINGWKRKIDSIRHQTNFDKMIKIIDVDILYTTIVVALEPTLDEWNAFKKKYKAYITNDDEKCFLDDFNNNKGCNGSTIQLDRGDYMIFVRYAKEHGDIAHEVFHACNCILKSRGFELTDTGESYAYLIGFVTNKVYEILDNKG